MSTAISVDRLTKEFSTGFWRSRPFRALDGLSLDVPMGGVFGLLGPNGAGKSTTLKILMNLLWPTAGRAEVLGRPPGDVEARRRLGFLPENPAFYDHLTAEELLTYFAGLFGYAGGERQRRAASALDLVGLAEARRRPIRGYSKGMIQRVGLAQALVNDPELVVLDEPMSGLDPLGRKEVREIIMGLRDIGRTVVFSSHILSDAEMLCSRVGIISKGRVVASGTLSELTADAHGGAELVFTNLSSERAEQAAATARRVTAIADRRYSIELPAEVRPEPLIADLAASGAHLISVSPVRTTLEDVFVRSIGGGAGDDGDRREAVR